MSQNSNDEESTFGADLVAFIVSSILAAWAMYTTFLVMGALAAAVLERFELRAAVAMLLAVVIPVITAMGMNSRKEGAEGIQRLTRVNIGASIFAAGCAVIVCLTMADKVVSKLTFDPNWFLDNPEAQTGTPATNRKYSNIVADMACKSAHAIGTYYCPDS